MNVQSKPLGPSVVNMRSYDPDIIGSIFTRVDLAWSKDARARFIVTDLGELSLIRSVHTASKSKSRRLERHIKNSDVGHHFACLPLSGGVRVRQLCRDGGASADDVVQSDHLTLVNSSEEYEIEMSDELDAIWLRIPSKLLRSHAIAVDECLRRPLNIQRGLGFMAKEMMKSAISDQSELSDRCARVLSHSLLSFIGEVINDNLQTEAGTSTRGRRMILRRAQEFIEEHIHDDDLTPAMIAKGVGISSRYLSDIFAAEGMSPMRWVRQRRLEMCRMELERRGAGQQLICEVAYSMGFTNVSSFNRAFKAQFGLSPRELIAQNATPARHFD